LSAWWLCLVALVSTSVGADESMRDRSGRSGLWQPLVASKKTWKLFDYNLRQEPNDHDAAIVVENYDLRRVGPVAVARFRWKTREGEDVGDRRCVASRSSCANVCGSTSRRPSDSQNHWQGTSSPNFEYYALKGYAELK